MPTSATLAALAPARQYIGGLIVAAGRRHLHLRQPGRLRADEHQAAAGLFDDRARRLHDDARGRRRGPGRQRARPAPDAAVAALVFYIGIYLFMNLGAFAIVAFLRNALGSEEIADYAGLVRRSPGLTVCMAIILFSLVGLPPLAGFSAKFTIFAALVDAGLLGLLVIGVLNTVLSLFYYLRVVRVMVLAEPADRPAPTITLGSIPAPTAPW